MKPVLHRTGGSGKTDFILWRLVLPGNPDSFIQEAYDLTPLGSGSGSLGAVSEAVIIFWLFFFIFLITGQSSGKASPLKRIAMPGSILLLYGLLTPGEVLVCRIPAQSPSSAFCTPDNSPDCN
jgi:hypothetical protein